MAESSTPRGDEAPRDVAQPPTDPAISAQVELAKGFTHQLVRAMKQIAMYRHQESKFPTFLEKTLEALRSYTSSYGPLTIKVDLNDFLCQGVSLLGEESMLPYKFFKDGVRSLIFQPSLTLTELVTFTVVTSSDPEKAGPLHTQLWQAQLSGLEFVLVEGFRLDELGSDDVEIEIDAIVEHLEARLRSASTDSLRFARINANDLDAKLTDIEQMKGLVLVGPAPATDELKQALQTELAEEEAQRQVPKMLSALFTVLESGLDDVTLVEPIFIALLDALLLQGEFGVVNQVVAKLRLLVKGPDEPMAKLLASFQQKMGDEQRLNRLGDALRSTKASRPAEVSRYLSSLTGPVVPTLLDLLDTLEVAENRALFVEALSGFLKFGAEPYLVRLQSDRPALVRDVATMLEKAKHPDRLKHFAEVIKQPNPAIKRELIAVLASSPSAQSRSLVLACLDDAAPAVRAQAARTLFEFGADKAFADLVKVVKLPAFAARATPEREAFYAGIAACETPAAQTFLLEQLKLKGGLFQRAKVAEEKLVLVRGIAEAGSVRSIKLLTELSLDTSQPIEVQGAAKQAAYRLRKSMFGEEPTGTGTAAGAIASPATPGNPKTPMAVGRTSPTQVVAAPRSPPPTVSAEKGTDPAAVEPTIRVAIAPTTDLNAALEQVDPDAKTKTGRSGVTQRYEPSSEATTPGSPNPTEGNGRG